MKPSALEIQSATDARARRNARVALLFSLGLFLCCCTTYGVSFYYFFKSSEIETRIGKIYEVKYSRSSRSHQFGYPINCITDSNRLCPQTQSERTQTKGRKFSGIFFPIFIVVSIDENGKQLYFVDDNTLSRKLLLYMIGLLFFPFVPFGICLLSYIPHYRGTTHAVIYQKSHLDSSSLLYDIEIKSRIRQKIE